jgi:hypothetical protein
VTDVYAAIEQLIASDGFAVAAVCEALNVSRSAYYAWCEETPKDRERRDEQLMPAVRDIFWEHQRRYPQRQPRRRGRPAGTPLESLESGLLPMFPHATEERLQSM